MRLYLPCSLTICLQGKHVNREIPSFRFRFTHVPESQISSCDHMQRVIGLERYLLKQHKSGPRRDLTLLLYCTLSPSLTLILLVYYSSLFQSSLPAHAQSEALCRDQASKRADGNAHAGLLSLQHDSPYARTIHVVSNNIADDLAYCHPTSLPLSTCHCLPADSQGPAAVFIHLPGMYKYSSYNTCKGSFLGLAHHVR